MDINLLTEGLDQNSIPQKFIDAQTGGFNVKAMVDSYGALERKMSSQPKAPSMAEDYCIDCSQGLFEPDNQVNQRLHSKGLTQEQVQEVYDLAAEKMVPMIAELMNDFQADREVEKLVNHFGGEEKWAEVSKQLLSFGQKNLPKDVLDNLAGSYEGVLALYRMMKSEDPSLGAKSAQMKSVDVTDINELKSLMRDPKYWRDKDPSVMEQVTQGFQKIYGNS